MHFPIQTVYLLTSLVGVMAMVPQVRRLVTTKQSDQFSLTTWIVWGMCQVSSFAYATSINATAYMIVGSAWITFYAVMIFLIIKYRKRRSLFATLAYWVQRGRTEKDGVLSLHADTILPVAKSPKKT